MDAGGIPGIHPPDFHFLCKFTPLFIIMKRFQFLFSFWNAIFMMETLNFCSNQIHYCDASTAETDILVVKVSHSLDGGKVLANERA